MRPQTIITTVQPGSEASCELKFAGNGLMVVLGGLEDLVAHHHKCGDFGGASLHLWKGEGGGGGDGGEKGGGRTRGGGAREPKSQCYI